MALDPNAKLYSQSDLDSRPSSEPGFCPVFATDRSLLDPAASEAF